MKFRGYGYTFYVAKVRKVAVSSSLCVVRLHLTCGLLVRTSKRTSKASPRLSSLGSMLMVCLSSRHPTRCASNVCPIIRLVVSDVLCDFSEHNSTDFVQSLHETYRFAKLKSWAATTEACTFKVSPDEGKHQLQKEQVVYTTEMVSCSVSRSSLPLVECLLRSSLSIEAERSIYDAPCTDDRRKTYASC